MADPIETLLRRHIDFLARAPRNGRTSPEHLAASLGYCASVLDDLGWSVERQQVVCRNVLGVADHANPWWPFGWYSTLTGTNLVASWGANDPAMVIVAHIDTVGHSPGADDNASGVAAALAAAKLIAESGTNQRVLIGLVDLEETGHQGSEQLARQLRADQVGVAGVICLESLGYYDPTPGAQKLPKLFRDIQVDPLPSGPVAADFMALLARSTSAALADAWAVEANLCGLKTVRFLDRRPDGWRSHVAIAFKPALANLDRSDHASFQAVGIPAICVCDTPPLRSPHYHQVSDLPGTLDYPRMAAAARATAATAGRQHRLDAKPTRGSR